MALTDIGADVRLPSYSDAQTATGTTTLDADGEKAAFILQSKAALTLRKIGFYVSTWTQCTNGLTVRVEEVDPATGDPSGTIWDHEGASENYFDIAIGAVGYYEGTLTADAVIPAGTVFAIVIQFKTFATSDSLVLSVGATSGQSSAFPYTDAYATGAWTKKNQTPLVYLEDSAAAVVRLPQVWPPHSTSGSSYAVANDHSPDEYALVFRLPFGVRCSGFWASLDIDSDVTMTLFSCPNQADLTVQTGESTLATLTLDKDVRVGTGAGGHTWSWPTPVALTANTWYRLSSAPTSTTHIAVYYRHVNVAAQMAAYAFGVNMYECSRTDAGAWTLTTTRRPLFGLLVDQIDVAAGGGGAPTEALFGLEEMN